MKTLPRNFLIALTLIIPLSACMPTKTTETPPPISASPAPIEWLYEDLLLLDPIDTLSTEDPDLFAVYYRSTEDNWAHIRLDILSDEFSNYQIVLDIADVIVAQEANKNPHLLLNISYKNGIWHAVATQSNDSSIVNFPILIDELPETHSVIVSFPENYLMKERAAEIMLSNSSAKLVDSATVPSWDSSPPPKAPLLLAFWDVLPANTPAQLLQRWDGAHTGPYGSRHGLKHLLAAVEEYQIPVTLLDLKDPGTLSGLDLIGQNDYIQELEEQELLILPETVITALQLKMQAANFSKSTSLVHGYPPKKFAYSTFRWPPPNLYDLYFAFLWDQNHIFSLNHQRLIPLPYFPWVDTTDQQVQEVDRDGLTRQTWSKLLETALSADNSDLLVIGGSVTTSPLADSALATPAFQDMKNHPWIQMLSESDLHTFSLTDSKPDLRLDGLDLLVSHAPPWAVEYRMSVTWDAIRTYLEAIPQNDTSDTNVLMAYQILRPANSADRFHLQSNYWTQLFHIWSNSTLATDASPKSTCELDIDTDEVPECIFASKNTTATFEIADASLITTFHLDDSDATQWVGPTSQIVVGMSDPLFWDLDAGTHSDPSVIPGSFILDTAEPLSFEVSDLDEEHIRFTSTDGSISKDYRFTNENLTVTIETDQPIFTDLVLALDPQQRFQPGWADNYNIFSQTDASFCWGNKDNKAVCVSWTGDPEIEINTFKDSLDSLSQPLDPNKVYPPGHFLPMSLATVSFSTDKDFTVTLSPYPIPTNQDMD